MLVHKGMAALILPLLLATHGMTAPAADDGRERSLPACIDAACRLLYSLWADTAG